MGITHPRNAEIAKARAAVGARAKQGQPAERINAARTDLATAVLAESISRALAAAPPLSAEQRLRLTALIIAPATPPAAAGAGQ